MEHIIREDYLVEGLEITEMFLDLILARVGLINLSNEIDPGMAESISSVIWVQPRIVTECGELKIVCDELMKKYGKGRAIFHKYLKHKFLKHLLQKFLKNFFKNLLKKFLKNFLKNLLKKFLKKLFKIWTKIPLKSTCNLVDPE